MFNETQTYKDLLVARLEEEQDKAIQAVDTGDGVKAGYYRAMEEAIRIVQENDIPPVMQEPIKTK